MSRYQQKRIKTIHLVFLDLQIFDEIEKRNDTCVKMIDALWQWFYRPGY